MRELNAQIITEKVKQLCVDSNYFLGEDVFRALKNAQEAEESPLGKEIISQLIENVNIARDEKVPLCQDTGFAVFFVELGQDVHLFGGNLIDAINEGVRQGYKEGYLRKSICNPFTRANTGDNTPAIVHLEMVPGEKVKITFAAKGGGSENMSGIAMLKPSDGIEGVKNFVVNRVKEAGSNPCPPIVVGIGIGGTFEKTALLAKKALMRPLGTPNPDPELASLEKELHERINALGIGPQGFGGRITALAVNVEMHPCHIASLPVAVNIECHASRHRTIVI